jgi:hypothetical protein
MSPRTVLSRFRALSPRRSAWPLLAALALTLWQPAVVRAQIPDPLSVEDFQLPPQNAEGWTQLSPSTDSRLVYVDSVEGNDSTARIYAPGDSEIGPDPQSPLGPVRAYRTLAAAHAQTRHDQPDWMLLRAGRVWTGQSLSIKRGRSASERQVVIRYGAGDRPELRTGTQRGLADSQISNAAIMGLRFWAHTRDTDGPHFQGFAGSSGISLFTRQAGDVRQVRDVLIEDCVFRAYANNVLTGSNGNGALPITRFVMRRNIVSGNFSEEGHAQGLYHVGAGQPLQPSILLEENLFDHNGWRIQSREGNSDRADGQATMFNHNTYFTAANGVIFRGNFFLRASSIGNKWTSTSRGVVVEDNLYAEGEIGMSIGGNHAGAYRFRDYVLRDNVLTDMGRTRPTNRSLGWGIELKDWDSGNVTGNLVIHLRSGIGNAWGLQVTAADGARDTWIAGNVLAGLESGGPVVRLEDGGNLQSMVFRDNTVQIASAQPSISIRTGGYVFAGNNRYQSPALPVSQFRINGNNGDLNAWRSATGDNGATVGAITFPDPERSLERYASELGLGNDLEALIDALYQQSRSDWNPALTAPAINRWLRGGFGLGGTTQHAVTRFVLTDAAGTVDIGVIENGAQFQRSSLPATLNIRAETTTPGSVAFLMSGPVSLDRFENNPPYTAAVEPSGFSSDAGSYSLTATPYELDDMGGQAGTALTRSFVIVDSASGEFRDGFESASSGR